MHYWINAQGLGGNRRNTCNICPVKCIPKLIFKTTSVPKLLSIWGLFGLSNISFKIYFCKHNFVVLLSLKAGVNLFYDDIGINFARPIQNKYIKPENDFPNKYIFYYFHKSHESASQTCFYIKQQALAHEFTLLIAKVWNTGMTPHYFFSVYQFISHKFAHLNINLIGLNNQMKNHSSTAISGLLPAAVKSFPSRFPWPQFSMRHTSWHNEQQNFSYTGEKVYLK